MSIPLRTRVALFLPAFAISYVPLIATGVLIALLFTKLNWITLIYITCRVIDHRAPHRGGWSRPYLRGFFDVLKAHFPCRFEIVDKSRFDHTKNYIFCAHPHGAVCFASFINFTSMTIKDQLGLDSSLVVLPPLFLAPGTREIFLSLGATAASSDNMNHVLETLKGYAIAALPGGARECELFSPHSMNVRTSAVRGYAKLALQHGAYLVPVINFGETDIYFFTRDKLSPLRRFLTSNIEQWCSAKVPNITGHGHLGALPFRKPLTTLVGNPIRSPKLANPSFNDVQGLYLDYCEALKDLYYANRDRFGYHDVDMNIVID